MGAIGVRKKDDFKFTENFIQSVLQRQYFSNYEYWLCNLYVFRWESDFLAKTKSGYWHEVEIKITFADFKNDAKNKGEKFEILETGNYHHRGDLFEVYARPNYFSYCVPYFLVDDVLPLLPDYAGLYSVSSDGRLSVKKQPLQLHKEKIDDNDLNLMKKFYYNYKTYERKYNFHRDEIQNLKNEISFWKAEFEAASGCSTKDIF